MTEYQIVEALAKTDPVYGPVKSAPRLPNGQFSSVRICALCRARSGHNEENVRHEAACPWIPAKKMVKAATTTGTQSGE
jgi:hypothetical protein